MDGIPKNSMHPVTDDYIIVIDDVKIPPLQKKKERWSSQVY